MNFIKKLKSLKIFDYIFVLLEIIILGILVLFQIKTLVTCSDLVKYTQLYYPGAKICKIFLIALPLLWIISYFISFIFEDKHEIKDLKNLMVVYVLLGFIANMFTLTMEDYPLINMIIFFVSYLLLGITLMKDLKELVVHAISIILFIALGLVVSSLRTPIGIVACLCASLLLSNLILTILKLINTKDKFYIYILLGVSFALISDLSIGLRTAISNNNLNNVVSMIVWPTYVISLVAFIFGYNIYHQGLEQKEKDK